MTPRQQLTQTIYNPYVLAIDFSLLGMVSRGPAKISIVSWRTRAAKNSSGLI